MEKYLKKLLMIACLACPAATLAEVVKGSVFQPELEVIVDRGGQPISPYLPKKVSIDNQPAKKQQDWRKNGVINSRYPILTRSMTVGPVGADEGRDINFKFATRPMFIVGYDPVSLNWLKSNKHHLAEKKAIGLVVNVQSADQMEQLMLAVERKVLLQPTQGDSLAKSLKIKHYPFYMDGSGVLR
jgi:integrating conjugative element protein (TIGR03765 family)